MDANVAFLLVVGGVAATAVAAALWALRVTDGARGAEARWKARSEAAEDRLQRWDSLIGAFPGVALVWEQENGAIEDGHWGEPKIYGSPLALASLLRFSDAAAADSPAVRILQGLSGFKGKDGSGGVGYLAPALTRLRREGRPFSLTISSANGMFVEVDGRTAGARAVVWVLDASVKGVEESGAAGRLEEARQVIARDPAAFLEMLARAPFLAFRLSAALRLEWANAAYVTALDAKDLESAIARNVMLDPLIADQARRVLEAEGEIEDMRWLTAMGERRAFRVRMFPAAGGVAGMAFDVTDVEAARLETAKVAKAHDETLDALAEGVAVFGPDKRLIFHNRAFAALFGLDSAFLAERPSHGAWLDALKERRRLPAHVNYTEWRADELAAHQQMGELPEQLWSLPDGRTLRIAKKRHPLGGLLLIFSDMTHELALKSQYAALLQVQRAALDRLHEGIVVFGLDGRMRLHNAAFSELWGLDPAKLEGVSFADVIEMWRPMYHNMEQWAEIRACISDPSPEARREHRGEMRRSDGSVVEYLTRPLPDGATLIAFLDVTASKRVEEALRERAEAFEAADRLKTEFVENVSYQLRTPLQTICGFAELLSKMMAGPLNDRQRDHIQMILSASESLTKLVDNVIDVASIEAGKLELELRETSLNDLVHEAAAINSGKARDQEVKLAVEVEPGLGTLRADPKRLKQALVNLVSNALRFTEKGDVITIGAARSEGVVRLYVRDTGRGMTPELQAAAFGHFVSGDRRGAGLGLSLVRSFIEGHGGWVSLESEPGQGALVTCHLPDGSNAARWAAE